MEVSPLKLSLLKGDGRPANPTDREALEYIKSTNRCVEIRNVREYMEF